MEVPTPDVIRVNGDLPPSLRGLPIVGGIEMYALSPDRRRVALVAVRREEDPRRVRLYCCDLRTHRMRLLDQRTGEGGAQLMRWSPDGRRIVFARMNEYFAGSVNLDGVSLCDVDPDSGHKRDLTRDLWGDGSGCMIWHRPGYIVFSPDGERLLLVQGGSRFEVENKRLVCRDYATNRLLWTSEAGIAAIHPAWSPDGARIAYVACPDATRLGDGNDISYRHTQQHLYVRDADGRNVRQLTRNPKFREEDPRWDGATGMIRFERCDNADRADNVPYRSRRSLWEIRPDGANLRKLRDLPPDPPG